jgi:hypothetical protein
MQERLRVHNEGLLHGVGLSRHEQGRGANKRGR